MGLPGMPYNLEALSYVSVTLCFNIHLELDVVACLRHWRKSQLFPGCANALAFV